jgi:hypothetical protein
MKPHPMNLHLVSAEIDKRSVRTSDPLEGFRDRRHERESAYYQVSSPEQWKVNELNSKVIP